MRFAYHSSGWWQAPAETVMGEVRAIGYDGIDLAPHPASLPLSSWTAQEALHLRDAAETCGLAIASLDLAGPHLLGATRHEPSLISLFASQREERLDLLRRGIDFAAELGTSLVTLRSGPLSPDLATSFAKQHFLEGLEQVLELARSSGIRLAIEPMAGDLIDSYPGFLELLQIFGTETIDLCYNFDEAHGRYEDALAVLRGEDGLGHLRLSDCLEPRRERPNSGERPVDLAPLFAQLSACRFNGFISVQLLENFPDPQPATTRALAKLRASEAQG